jgi:transcriptional regulator with XRE-family HTH domain
MIPFHKICQRLNNNHLFQIMTTQTIHRLVGEQIKQLREAKCISQEELGFRANLHRTYIGQIERAEGNITLKNLAKIAMGLDVDIRVFFSV